MSGRGMKSKSSSVDVLACGKCGSIFHQLEQFIQHKVAGCALPKIREDKKAKHDARKQKKAVPVKKTAVRKSIPSGSRSPAKVKKELRSRSSSVNEMGQPRKSLSAIKKIVSPPSKKLSPSPTKKTLTPSPASKRGRRKSMDSGRPAKKVPVSTPKRKSISPLKKAPTKKSKLQISDPGEKISLLSDSDGAPPKFKGLTGYLWKKRLMQQQLKQQKKMYKLKSKKKSKVAVVTNEASSEEEVEEEGEAAAMEEEERKLRNDVVEEEGSEKPLVKSESSSKVTKSKVDRCGECSGCLQKEDCGACESCKIKAEHPDADVICSMRECESEGEVFKVEKVLGKRIRNDRVEYLLKWKGYPESENCWEPEENILSRELIEDYERRQKQSQISGKRSLEDSPLVTPIKKIKIEKEEPSSDVGELMQEDNDISEVAPVSRPVESRIGRSCKRAAMNFIKTVCLHGRRPVTPETIGPLSEDVHSSADEIFPNTDQIYVYYLPHPDDPDKVITVKGNERKINLLKNSDLNPFVQLGNRSTLSDESIALLVQQYKLSKKKLKPHSESPRKIDRKVEDKSKPGKMEKGKIKVEKIMVKNESGQVVKTVKSNVLQTPKERVLSKSSQIRAGRDLELKEKKKITYKEKIESLIAKEKLLESLDTELTSINIPSGDSAPSCEVISLSDMRQKLYGSKERNVGDKLKTFQNEQKPAEVLKLAEIRLGEAPKQAGSPKQNETVKVVEIQKAPEVPREGARKMFRPLRPKGMIELPQNPPQEPKITQFFEKKNARKSTQATIPLKPPVDDSSKDRVFVVMPDGSMVEISPAAEQAIVKKTPEALKKAPMKKADNTPPSNKVVAGRKRGAPQPSLEDCTADIIDDAKTLKLPNTLQLVESELPLSEAENSSKLIGMFLFRQVISPNDSGHKCLLCPTKSTWKYVSELEKHYHYVHEITVQHFKAEFSENVVFVCVPQDVTELTTLNSACRFCDSVLKNLSEVRNHYPSQHSKAVRLVQETAVTDLSSMFYCSICSHASSDFLSHHQHMKTSHRMQTYVCRYCTFCTSRPNRLKTHVKQRHPQQQQNQAVHNGSEEKTLQQAATPQKNKLKCPVCLLLMGGKDNLDRHVLIAHSVQTGPETWSCAKCLLSCGPANELAAHLPKCPRLKADSPVKTTPQPPAPTKRVVTVYKCVDCANCFTTEKEIKEHVSDTKHSKNYDILKHLINSSSGGGTNVCFLCEMKFTSAETYRKHLLHIHMEWVDSKTAKNFKKTEMSVGATKKNEAEKGGISSNSGVLQEVSRTNGENRNSKNNSVVSNTSKEKDSGNSGSSDSSVKQVTTQKTSGGTDVPSMMTMKDLPSDSELLDLGGGVKVGHYCYLCDAVIKSYSLFYLHMQNVHSLEKKFQCVISSCGFTTRNPAEFQRHTKIHKQSVTHACSVCDTVFETEDELKQHKISPEHGDKYMKMHEKCRPGGVEPRNYRCKACQSWFGLRSYFITHMETEHHNYKCPHCGLQFLQPGSRRLHLQQIHPKVSNTCEFCGTKLNNTQELWSHLTTHDIVHECKICHRRFLQVEQLTSHLETHDPATECPWEGCTKKFISKISLFYHLKMHRGDEDHKCPFCKKGFIKVKLLEAHMRVHEAEAAVKNAPKEKTVQQQKEKPSDAKQSTSESELIQLICGGCNQGFDDEDQFAAHSCNVQAVTLAAVKSSNSLSIEISSDLPKQTASSISSASDAGSNDEQTAKEGTKEILGTAEREDSNSAFSSLGDTTGLASPEKTAQVAENESVSIADETSVSTEPAVEQVASDPKESASEEVVLEDTSVVETDDRENDTSTSVPAESIPEEEESNSEIPQEVNASVPDLESVETAVSTEDASKVDEEIKDDASEDLKVPDSDSVEQTGKPPEEDDDAEMPDESNMETDGSSPAEQTAVSEEMEKGESKSSEKVEELKVFASESDDNNSSEKFLIVDEVSNSAQDFEDALNSEQAENTLSQDLYSQPITSGLEGLEDSESITEALTQKPPVEEKSGEFPEPSTIVVHADESSHSGEAQSTVVMMVTDQQESGQELQMEMSEDSPYAGTTLLKVPTSDGQQVLLIPFSSTQEGTTVLSLPPGLTLGSDASQGENAIEVTLEHPPEVENNSESTGQAYLHMPVDSESVAMELLPAADEEIHQRANEETLNVASEEVSLQNTQDLPMDTTELSAT